MGIFSYFSKDASAERKRSSAAKRLANMYYQSVERMGAAQEMAELVRDGDNDALLILLSRFEHMNQSAQIDRDEKEHVVELLKGLGQQAVEGTQNYVRSTTEAIYWPMRYLQATLDAEAFQGFLADMLAATEPGYARDPKKKLGLVQLAREHANENARAEVIKFLNDHDEDVRFHAIDVAMLLDSPGAREALGARWASEEEESGRIWNRIADCFVERGWRFDGDVAVVRGRAPFGVGVADDGAVTRMVSR